VRAAGISLALGLAMSVVCAQEPATPAQIYLIVTGSDRAVRTGSWERLRSQFSDQLAEASRGHEQVILLAGSAQPPAGANGVLVNVYVLSYFYVSPWVRSVPLAGGRQATLNATVRVRDLRTGTIVAETSYDKMSRRSDGEIQEATEMQVRAIVEEIVQAARRPVVRTIPAAVALPAAPRADRSAASGSPTDANEIVFWESVRNSPNAAELQAYIDQYPNGTFVALAKARLAALGRK